MSDICTCGVCDGCRVAMNDYLCESLCLVQSMCLEIGAIVTFTVRDEEDVSRDQFQSIKEYLDATTKEYQICAMDITYQPNVQTLQKSGLYEESDVSLKTPTKCWLDKQLEFRQIDIKRTTVMLGGVQYKIREKGRDQVVVDTVPLFYSFGLVKP